MILSIYIYQKIKKYNLTALHLWQIYVKLKDET